jgi:hypothetical protein
MRRFKVGLSVRRRIAPILPALNLGALGVRAEAAGPIQVSVELGSLLRFAVGAATPTGP